MRPLLRQLVGTPYFKYFKAALWCDCPFWPDDGMCMLRDCSVGECDSDEVPSAFREEDAASCSAPAAPCLRLHLLPDRQNDRCLNTVVVQHARDLHWQLPSMHACGGVCPMSPSQPSG